MECFVLVCKIHWSLVLFKSTVSLLIFCQDDISIVESRVSKSPTIIILLRYDPLRPKDNHCQCLQSLKLNAIATVTASSPLDVGEIILSKGDSLSIVITPNDITFRIIDIAFSVP